MKEGNIAVAQSGGPTAAINASLCGVIKKAAAESRKIYGILNGIQGALENRFIDLGKLFRNRDDLYLLKMTPAAYLGSCRYCLPDPGPEQEIYETVFSNLKKLNITMVAYIGGNDSMDTVMKLSRYAELHKKDISFVGIPKTIDNDLMGTDHTPGFGSAAKFVATAVSEIARDCSVYLSRSVTVVEIMGRNAGWLTAASALARSAFCDAPHLIYLPEKNLSVQKIIDDFAGCTARNAVIAVSEGVKNENGVYLSDLDSNTSHDKFGHAQLCGAARVVESIIKTNFGIKTRSVELNVLQRCSSHFASLTDLNESECMGIFGTEKLLEGETGVAVGMERVGNYEVIPICNDVSMVANLEKRVPDDFISANGCDVTEKAIEYLRPLILGEPEIITENGIPKQIPRPSEKE